MRKTFIFIALVISIALMFGACNTDVVGKLAVTSFEKMQEKAQVSKTENETSITSPTGNTFQFGATGTAMKFALAPFVEAGLDVNKLPSYAIVENDMLVIKQEYKADDFKSFVEKYRDKIDYHEALDHYGIDMGNGNKFEWAKDTEKNDKDVVFVLNPLPLKDAGVNVEKVEGFVYAEVEVKKGVKEFKLLAPYDLSNQTVQTSAEVSTDVVPLSNITEPTQASSEIVKASTEKVDKQEKTVPSQPEKTQPIVTPTPEQTTEPKEKPEEIVISKYVNPAIVNGNVQEITTQLGQGYTPITVQKGIPVKWTIQAEESKLNGCNNEMQIPKFDITKKLESGDNIIEFTPTTSETIPYSCWMGMIRSNITVVDDLSSK